MIGTLNGTSIVDATNPGAMVEAAFIAGPSSQWRDIKTWDHYAYIVTEGAGSGLQIVNLAATPPVLVGTYNTGFTRAHNLFIDEFGFAYICGTSAGLVVLSLADPENPVQVGSYTDYYIHDIYVREEVAYAAEVYRGALEVLNVEVKSAITPLGSVTYPVALTHNVWLTGDGLWALTTDETTGGHVRVFDVSNPASMNEVAHYQRDAIQTAHNVVVHGNFAYLSHYVHGLRVLDVTDPRFPSEVGGYDTFPSAPTGSIIYDGAWGVYPFSPSGNTFISDISTGLHVLSFSPDYGVIEGTINDLATGSPLEGVQVEVAGEAPVISVSEGSYRLTAALGTTPVTFSKFGYQPVQVDVEMVAGVPIVLDLDLVRVPSGTLGGFVTASGGSIPLQDVKVSVDGTPLGATSDSSGSYGFDPIPEGYYRVRFEKSGYVPRVEGVIVTEGNAAVLSAGLETAFLLLDMETDPGWIVGKPGDTATEGVWVRADPNGTAGGGVAPEDDATPDPGVLAWVTGNGIPGATIGVYDVDGGSTTLTSGPIGLPVGTTPPLLSYERWYSNNAGSVIDDSFLVEIRGDGGARWSTLEIVSGTETPWRRVRSDLSPYGSPGETIRLRFVASDTGGGSIVEAGIDQVEILETCQVEVNPSLPDADSDRNTDACDPCPLDPFDDQDGDTICGDSDNAPAVPNTLQEDADGDGVGDVVDNCTLIPNPDQEDADSDGLGNACDPDDDNDGLLDPVDPDRDGDGISDVVDLCQEIPDPLQADFDLDGEGDACDPDDGLVTGLRVDPDGRLTWKAEAGVDGYLVRRGTFQDVVDPATADCLPPLRLVPAALDPSPATATRGLFYLVASVTGGVEGPAGFAPDGSPRDVPSCP